MNILLSANEPGRIISVTNARVAERDVEASKTIFILVLRFFVVIVALLLYGLLSLEAFSDAQGFIAFTLLDIVYTIFEIRYLWREQPQRIWINPVVLASVLFAISFGITNILYFLPENLTVLVGIHPTVTPWMNLLMLFVVIATCSMWVGYSSGLGRGLARMIQQNRVLRRWISTSSRVRSLALYACVLISLIARLVEIKLGVFGFSADYNQVLRGVDYIQFLTMAESLGKLALVGAAIQCFASDTYSLGDRQLLWFVLIFEVSFGFLSGYKSGAVMPFFIVAVVYYMQRGRFPRWLIPAATVSIFVAYAIIEPFRAESRKDTDFKGTDLGSISSTLFTARESNVAPAGDTPPTWLSFLSRNNMVFEASLGLEFAAKYDLPPDSPEFLRDIFLAPVYALVPRVFWKGKPLGDLGMWYTHEVLGRDIEASSGMSPIGYLNFAGGPIAIVLGFVIVGIVQRGFFDGLVSFGTGGLLILLGLLTSLAVVDSAFYSFFIGFVRQFPILIVAQIFLLKRQPLGDANG